jgi:UDPglucose 6-dehydrogenase
MRIAVIGTGYVGLVTGTCLADSGHVVVCLDVVREKIDKLRKGEIPFYEPGLSDLVHHNVAVERLSFTTDPVRALADAEVVFIAVGTPQSETGAADLTYIFQAADSVKKHAPRDAVVVVKSTVPVGTCDRVAERVGAEYTVVSNPEFLKEGAAVEDFMRPDRVVVGAADDHGREVMRDLYEPFTRSGAPILMMDRKSAELVKYAANCMLAVKISFMNQVAALCEAVGADVDRVRIGVGSDPRVGRSFLFPGAGYGGSCFPKDTRAMVARGRELGVDLSIVRAADDANDAQKAILVRKVKEHFGAALAGRRLALWGLAFKPNTDDVREAPAILTARQLVEAGAEVVAYDPQAKETARKELGDSVKYVDRPLDACKGADALLVMTEWNEFRRPNFPAVAQAMKSKVVFDGRNLYDPEAMRRQGFTYYSVGRPVAKP